MKKPIEEVDKLLNQGDRIISRDHWEKNGPKLLEALKQAILWHQSDSWRLSSDVSKRVGWEERKLNLDTLLKEASEVEVPE